MIDRFLDAQTFFLEEMSIAMDNIKKMSNNFTVHKVKIGQTRCEWNPDLKCPAFHPRAEGDCPYRATVTVGKIEKWNLCERCANLPEFYTKRRTNLVEVPS